MKKYTLAIDQGTTSTRAIIFNENFEIVSNNQKDWMYKTLHDEKNSLCKSLKKKGVRCLFFGPGYELCKDLSLKNFLSKKKLVFQKLI